MSGLGEAACNTKVPIEGAGKHIINLPMAVDCGSYAYCKWFLVNDDESWVRQQGELELNGVLTQFYVNLEGPGIFKYIVMKVTNNPPNRPS